MKGILNVYKPQDWTSFDVVNYLKKFLKMKQIGHLGTLDPMATGVLPVTLGSATKLFDLFLRKEKTYIAKFKFGFETDSLDKTGQIVKTNTKNPTIDEIEAILPNFLGEIEQIPPKFSAKKINGKKACDVARAGGEIELKPAKVFIKSLKILDYKDKELTLKIECGAGTYIRALGRDISYQLNTFATMTELLRTEVGVFKLEDAINIKDLSLEELKEKILPIDIAFNHLPILQEEEIVTRLLNGQTVINNLEEGEYRLYKYGEFIALAKNENHKIKMTKYFG